MGRRGYVPLKRLGTYHLDAAGCFIWDLFETLWRRTDGTSYQQDVVKTYHWDVLVRFHWDVIGCFIWDLPTALLGRTKRRRYDVATTSRCRVGYALFHRFPAFWTSQLQGNMIMFPTILAFLYSTCPMLDFNFPRATVKMLLCLFSKSFSYKKLC